MRAAISEVNGKCLSTFLNKIWEVNQFVAVNAIVMAADMPQNGACQRLFVDIYHIMDITSAAGPNTLLLHRSTDTA